MHSIERKKLRVSLMKSDWDYISVLLLDHGTCLFKKFKGETSFELETLETVRRRLDHFIQKALDQKYGRYR